MKIDKETVLPLSVFQELVDVGEEKSSISPDFGKNTQRYKKVASYLCKSSEIVKEDK